MSVAQKDAERNSPLTERIFPLRIPYDILEGEKEALEEKLELLFERNMTSEMNMKKSDVTSRALKEDVEKLNVSDNVRSKGVKLNQQRKRNVGARRFR